MNDLNTAAAAVVQRLHERGWRVQFVVDKEGPAWECSRLVCVPGLGQFVRIGCGANVFALWDWVQQHDPQPQSLSA